MIDSDEQLDRYLIQLGYEDIKVSWASNGEFLTYDDIHRITGFVERGQKITQGLHRHGVDPSRYFTMERDGEFPTKLIIVHESDGSATESYIYTPEEEANCIAEAEKRLPPIQLPENADPDAPKPLHPAIDIINLYEARDCAELGKEIKEAGQDPKTLFYGETPLMMIHKNDEERPVNSMMDLFNAVKLSGREGLKIQRYKGLGEMNAEQLWETTMNPATRKMIQVTIDDAVEAERMFTLLMGDAVEPRREYIERHAAGVKDLDI